MSTDVLVVGAGPTGLTAAIELARRGVGVRVIDKVEPRPYAESRAEGIHARTLEVFERLGVLPQVLARGRVLAGFAFVAGGRHLGDLRAGGLDSPHAYSVLLPQSEVEDILLGHLRGLGVDVERPIELVGLTQEAGRVDIRLRLADGTDHAMSARYLVAADGGHSTVRGLLGLAFDGVRTQGAYVMDAEAEFATPLAADRGTFVLARGGFLVVGRRPDGTHRIALSLPAYDERISRARPTLDELQLLLDDFPGLGVRLRSVSWSSAFFISARAVTRLRQGHVFLAGDSAHTHSPVGGQGMNTGIADAVNLAWKLALTVDGRGGEALLDTYETERLPIVSRLIRSTTASTGPLLWHNPIAVALRNAALRVVLQAPALQTRLFDGFTGFTVTYGPPRRRVGRAPRGPRVGEIAPESARGANRWYLRWGDDTRHQLLLFAGPELALETALAWAEARVDVVRAMVVAPQRHGAVDTVLDPTGELHRRFGAERGAGYLIRPDGHVAARTFGPDLAPLTAYAAQLSGRIGSRSAHPAET